MKYLNKQLNIMDIEKLFKLSKIEFQSQRLEEVQIKLSNVLAMVDSMHAISCEPDLEETQTFSSNLYFRKDEVHSINTRDDLFANLPAKEKEFAQKSGYYRVSRIVDN
jgi:aspartyl/glutamyl-tRNA(Asn/Gln) amidotransferase C subunit